MNRALALLLLCMPLPSFAQTHDLPMGCSAYVTIQYRLCIVSHHYTCRGDDPGIQHRVDIDNDGPLFISTIDQETQWIESFDLRRGIIERLVPNPQDAASFTELTRTDRDEFDFSTRTELGEVLTFRGRDRLTGRTVVIDDVPLLETDTYARATRADGSLAWESQGNEYIHLDWRIFLRGSSVTRTEDGSFQEDDAPVTFTFPGEDGFLADKPQFNCNALLL